MWNRCFKSKDEILQFVQEKSRFEEEKYTDIETEGRKEDIVIPEDKVNKSA